MKPRQAVFDYRVQLKVFEGPLDLLLHLIRVQELDIYDIPISTVTDQYLDYLKVMKDLNVNLAGEYLLMASNLILIKSRTLLPVDEKERHEEDSVEDPRRELVESLLEHEKCKSAAQALYSRETVELAVWPRGECEFEKEVKEAVSATVFDLVKSFHNLVERFKEDIILEVDRETVTLESKIREVRKLLSVQSEVFFCGCHSGLPYCSNYPGIAANIALNPFVTQGKNLLGSTQILSDTFLPKFSYIP